MIYKSDPGIKVKVIGVGGAGIKAVNRMIDTGLSGVEFIAIDLDVQTLQSSKAAVKVQIKSLYPNLTFPEFGDSARIRDRESAIAGREEIRKAIGKTDVVFIIAGLGGGTGSGVAPVITETSREAGALTVGIVTLPFRFEGHKRHEMAEKVTGELYSRTCTLITITPDQLLQIKNIQNISITEVFSLMDDILQRAVQFALGFITAGLSPDWINWRQGKK